MSSNLRIINTNVSSSAWTAVNDRQSSPAVGASYSLKTRTGANFLYALSSASNASYVTAEGVLALEGMRVGADGLIGYVKSTAASDVCEAVVVE